MGKINMGIFYGKKYNSGNRTFSLENGENFIEGTGHYVYTNNKNNPPKNMFKSRKISSILIQNRA